MNKVMTKHKIYISFFFLMTLIGFSGCKDNMMEEITELNVARAFSPTGLTALVVNRTGVRLSWNSVHNAKTYTIEFFENAEFTGAPVRVVSDITFLQVPFTVTGLAGDTQYFIRVKGVGENIADSKYVSANVRTDSEQIFRPVDATTLTSNSVVLTWPAGEFASSITLNPGNITRNITAAEVAAGSATITGLTSETLYTARLLNGTKTRGTLTFTTLLDLGGATAVYPTDNLATMIANAAPGQVLALFPGTYDINADIVVSKSISLRGARPSDRPLIRGLILRVRANAALGLKDLQLDGTGALNANQTIIYDEASTNAFGNLLIENCLIRNYVKGILYMNLSTLVENITYRNNVIHNIECNGGDFIDFRSGLARVFNFTNNTVYSSALARDLFRMDAPGTTNFPAVNPVININNNTFNAVCNGPSNRIFYIRQARHELFVSKNIIANSGGILTNQVSTNIVAANFTSNNYFNAPTYLSGSATSGAKYDTGTFTTLNPGFEAPASGNFRISELTLIANGIGDVRWR